jgi:hypothetical protein
MPVNTDRAAAFRASPPDSFVGKKFSNPEILNMFEILDHAHAVFGSISFIQMLHRPTGKAFTFKTKFDFAFLNHSAIFDFASGNTNRLTLVEVSASRAFVFFS